MKRSAKGTSTACGAGTRRLSSVPSSAFSEAELQQLLQAAEHHPSAGLCSRCSGEPAGPDHTVGPACAATRLEQDRARKRRWWAEHGPAWRAGRRAA